MGRPRKILVIDDELEMLENCARILKRLGYECLTCNNSLIALDLIKEKEPDLILTDLKMPNKDGLAIVREVHEFDEDLPVIVITGFASIESAVGAMKAGAYNYLAKPFSLDQFRLTVERALEQITLKEENRNLKAQIQEINFNNIIGTSTTMQKLFGTIRKVAKSEANILILGESGTGKELVARSLHVNSLREERPFVAVDCVSLPDQLLESELFGHVKGAYTGAYVAKAGLLEIAHTGTVFLDEIGDLSIGLQAKLLRVLQERQFRRLGGTSLIEVDIRVLAATNRDLNMMVKEGDFREDLYYRLNVITLNLAPLRERFGDIPPLVRHFCQQFSSALGKSLVVSHDAMQTLEGYHWPGNIRELKNTLEHAVAFAEGEQIETSDLPPYILTEHSKLPQVQVSNHHLSYMEAKNSCTEAFEREYLTKLLAQFGGNISRAAEEAKIDRKTIHRLVNKHGLKIERN